MTAQQSESDKILAEAMMFLYETAAKDGKITDEEMKLISEMEITLNYYKRALDKAYADDIITQEEVDQLNKLKEIIVSEGFDVADEFQGISKDEMNILVALICKLKVPKPSGE
ncbi:MAG: hypothetical protein ACXAD7_11910 [Candidatus Kariarchaeaceae archaeon]